MPKKSRSDPGMYGDVRVLAATCPTIPLGETFSLTYESVFDSSPLVPVSSNLRPTWYETTNFNPNQFQFFSFLLLNLKYSAEWFLMTEPNATILPFSAEYVVNYCRSGILCKRCSKKFHTGDLNLSAMVLVRIHAVITFIQFINLIKNTPVLRTETPSWRTSSSPLPLFVFLRVHQYTA